MRTLSVWTLTLSLLGAIATAAAQSPELFGPRGKDRGVAAVANGRPPLYAGLSELKMQVTTRSDAAQDYFNQGWRLIWAFNHAEARRSFRATQYLDPECAMCFWGEALALGPNINDPMHDDAIAPAFDYSRKALSLRPGTTELEAALIDALTARYAKASAADRAALDRKWAAAMGKVAEKFPRDPNVLTLYADALMNTQPWDYWEAGGETPKGQGAKIVDLLARALSLDPDHIGAAHLYIHALEASAHPEKAEAVADRLRGAAPGAGHLVHMPAHIYLRLGRHQDSIAVNRDAIAADEAFLARAGDAASAIYRFGYYPHNLHFLLASAQMAGLRDDAISAAARLGALTSERVSHDLPWVQAIQTAIYTAHAQFSDAETILALKPPGDQLPFVRGFWHYSRGVAFASRADTEAVGQEIAAIKQLRAHEEISRLEALLFPARTVLEIAERVIALRLAQTKGEFTTAESELRRAIELQDALPYMEPPYWYYPIRQTLGAVLLQSGRANEAARIFEKTLRKSPRNAWALWGLWRAQEAVGDSRAFETHAAFRKAWLGPETLLKLDRL